MTDRDIGPRHNGGPSLEDPPKRQFNKRRWAMTIFEQPDKPAGAVAMAFKLYMEMDANGYGAAVSDAEFAVCCGVSDRSSRTFKQWLLSNGFVQIKARGARGRQTEFIANIPSSEIAATVAGIMDQLPASFSGKDDDERQDLPVFPEPFPAIVTGNPESPRARAIVNNITTANIYPTNSESGERESEGKPDEEFSLRDEPVSATDLDALRVFETYNELAQRVGLPTARSLTPDRRKTIKRRLKENGGYEAWELALANIAKSAFLQGRNSRGWRPTGLNWFLEAGHFTKVIEGGYGNGAHADDGPPDETPEQRYSRILASMDDQPEAHK